MDRIDRDIIKLLSADGRMSYRDVAAKVFLSPNAVADRVRRLVESGAIKGFKARIDPAALGVTLQALVDIKLKPDVSALQFESAVRTIPDIVSASLVAGNYDYCLRVACVNQDGFVRVIEALRSTGGVQDTHSRFVLREIDLH
ncbi:Lrp/AsnC family transcriptional regulator [Massilia endophytica]|uniref:Lrp/AsnC family transcriptional regulator n=1 Tax=Massilia endophytica TaxID=2899220 RepID=UPI001E3F059B|nr:Lrp/AsnC family transcriptional regulator [Massilia endophytica]UGQ47712.1 Lrp/AsnC family transcriptional regulator [Massilia endophytica]